MLDRNAMLLLALVVGGCPTLLACNSLTGADDLELGNPKAKHHSPGASGDDGSASVGAGGGSGDTVGATSGGTGATDGTGTGSTDGTEAMQDAAGVSITQIAIYQGVKRPLMKDGEPATSNIPVVAGRDALVRVFIAVDDGYTGTPLTALLYVGESSMPIQVAKTLGNTSTDNNLESTINFDVPGASLAPGTNYRVELKQATGGSPSPNPGASFPASGFQTFGATSAGSVLKIKLVPIAYGADGSGRLPDTSAAQLQRYEDLFYGMYPVPGIQITVRNAVSTNQSIQANGSGWDGLLDAVANLRENDGPPADVYYMGIFQPASSFNNYCNGGCVAGLGMIGGPNDVFARVAIGLGYPGEEAAHTAVHEIGHTHGRSHAPCGGASGVDPNFPYGNGAIGAWGYDLVSRQLFSPNQTSDVMGYCSNWWVSDYTFKAIFNRIKTVNSAAMVFPPESLNLTYERARIDGNGNATWISPITLRTPPMGDPRTVTLQQNGNQTAIVGQYYPYDHLAGGIVVWPKQQGSYDAVQIDLGGSVAILTP